MRAFYLKLLQELDKLTGIKQYDKLVSTEDPKKEISALLDILCRTSMQFPMIPQEAQQNIIRQAVVSDQEFIGLNAKIIFKWLSGQKDRYFKEAHHIQEQPGPDWKPVEGEERDQWLKKWKEALGPFEERNVTESHVKTLEKKLPRKQEGEYHKSASAEYVMQRQLHVQWAIENLDPLTKELKPGGLPEEEWIKQYLK